MSESQLSASHIVDTGAVAFWADHRFEVSRGVDLVVYGALRGVGRAGTQ